MHAGRGICRGRKGRRSGADSQSSHDPLVSAPPWVRLGVGGASSCAPLDVDTEAANEAAGGDVITLTPQSN